MRIAVDAMGGDHAPREIVIGVVRAATELQGISKIILVGDTEAIQRELAACGSVSDKIEIRHASEVIAMHESPAQAVKRKKDSSISRALDMVKKGEADAVVSAGNTGAFVVAATLKLRTLEGIERPAIAAIMPTQGRPFVLVDAGANPDCTPMMLAQFAIMGSVYAKVILNQPSPLVGLMSIGSEEGKGNEVTKGARGWIAKAPVNFKGNIEGHDLFKGEIDVVVCDGFVGNVVLKTSESAAKAIGHWMKQEFKASPIRMLGALLLTGALKSMKRKMDPEMFGGAPLLGVGGICIKAHGGSSNRAIFNAIRVAGESVHHHMNELIVNEVSRMPKD